VAFRFIFYLSDALQFLQQLALALCELRWSLQPDFDEEVSLAMAIQYWNPLAADLQDGPGLRAFRNLQSVLGFKGWDFNLSSQRGLRERNWNRAVEIVSLALEEGMLLHVQHNVEISRRPAVYSGFPYSCETDAGTILNSSRNFRVNGFLLDDAAFPFAFRAGIADHAACALTCGTSTRD